MLSKLRKPKVGVGLSWYFSTAQFLADGMSFGQAVHQQFDSAPAGIVVGLITGSVRFCTTFFFQGSALRRYFRHESLIDDQDEESGDVMHIARVPALPSPHWAKPMLAHTFNYSFFTIRIAIEYFYNHFCYDSMMGWIESLSTGVHVGARALTPWEYSMIALYTLIVDVPFITTNEIYETCQGISRAFGVEVTPPMANVMRWIFKNNPRYVSRVGSFASAVLHAVPMICIIDPRWIHSALQIHWALVYMPGIFLGCGLLYLTEVNVVQTYLFEGRHSEANLVQASGGTMVIEPFENRVLLSQNEYEDWKIFYYWIASQGLFHAASDFWEAVDTMEDYTSDGIAYTVAFVIFVGCLLGTQFSEVMESQQRTDRLLRNSPHHYPYNTMAQRFFNTDTRTRLLPPPSTQTQITSPQTQPDSCTL